jgi:hypothetical protein
MHQPGTRVAEADSADRFTDQGGEERMVQPISGAECESRSARFRRLADEWRAATGFMSSVTEIAVQPAYQQIIGMGEAAVPFILEELRREPAQWFWALRAITGADPVPETSRGRVREMADAWLDWGRAHGYIE